MMTTHRDVETTTRSGAGPYSVARRECAAVRSTRPGAIRLRAMLRAGVVLTASTLALATVGCGVSPSQSDEPASTRCTDAGTTCRVHLVRGDDPQEFGHGKDRFAQRLGPARDRTVQMATRKGSDGRWFFNGGFGSGSGTLGSKVSDVSVGRIDVDSADARVVFHRGRAN